jgi:AcrR family transcriptional regulator
VAEATHEILACVIARRAKRSGDRISLGDVMLAARPGLNGLSIYLHFRSRALRAFELKIELVREAGDGSLIWAHGSDRITPPSPTYQAIFPLEIPYTLQPGTYSLNIFIDRQLALVRVLYCRAR